MRNCKGKSAPFGSSYGMFDFLIVAFFVVFRIKTS